MIKPFLTKSIPWIKQNKRLSLLIGLVLLCLVFISLAPLLDSTKQQPLPLLDQNKSLYKDLQPAHSTHQDIIDKLGSPTTTYEQDQYIIYSYPSTTSYYSPDLLYVADNILVLKELFFTPLQYEYKLDILEQQYGQPEAILYTPYNEGGQTKVYAYSNRGLAAYINQEGLVFKLQQFSPISVDTFTASWGKGLTEAQPTPPQEDHAHE